MLLMVSFSCGIFNTYTLKLMLYILVLPFHCCALNCHCQPMYILVKISKVLSTDNVVKDFVKFETAVG